MAASRDRPRRRRFCFTFLDFLTFVYSEEVSYLASLNNGKHAKCRSQTEEKFDRTKQFPARYKFRLETDQDFSDRFKCIIPIISIKIPESHSHPEDL